MKDVMVDRVLEIDNVEWFDLNQIIICLHGRISILKRSYCRVYTLWHVHADVNCSIFKILDTSWQHIIHISYWAAQLSYWKVYEQLYGHIIVSTLQSKLLHKILWETRIQSKNQRPNLK